MKGFSKKRNSENTSVPRVIEIEFPNGKEPDIGKSDFEVSKNTGYIKTAPDSVLMKVRERQKEEEEEEEGNNNLVIVWVSIAVELSFDLITGVIAILSTAGAATCCGHNLHLGPMAVKASIPFFFLLTIQITFLIQVILTTIWQQRRKARPSVPKDDSCCGFLSRWNAKTLLGYLNVTTIVNPFFGCLIAWILLYQSDKTESFLVLGIECLSIAVHLLAIRMVGGLKTCGSRALHSIVLIPLLITIVHVVLFLREGGVCYNSEAKGFGFSGCEICPDTLEPPGADGSCGEAFEGVFSRGIESILEGQMERGDYCSERVNFCFFEF